jgi:hypothetical protein
MTLEENDETTPGVSGTFDLIAGETCHSRPKLEVARARGQVNPFGQFNLLGALD